jgi:hypothetical protein
MFDIVSISKLVVNTWDERILVSLVGASSLFEWVEESTEVLQEIL